MRTTSPLVSLLALLGFGSALTAQSVPCFAANDQNSNVSNLIYSYSNAAPNTNAWQITPTSLLVAQSLRIYTRNTYASQVGAFMTLELWDEDPLSPGLPFTRLAGGTWQFNSVMSWQGTNLDLPVVLQPNTNYWVVLTEPGWSTPPTEPGGAAKPAARQVAGAWLPAGASALKVRIYCSLLDDQNVVPFGGTCAGASGSMPFLFTNQPPTLGNVDFRLEGTGLPAGALVFFVMGLQPGYPSVPIAGTPNCFLSTDTVATLVGTSGTGNVRAAAAFGHVTFPFALPTGAAWQGLYFSAQLAAIDGASTAALPLVTTNALQVTLY
jgi:hypothetical protein